MAVSLRKELCRIGRAAKVIMKLRAARTTEIGIFSADPVLFIDDAGLDDRGSPGILRARKRHRILNRYNYKVRPSKCGREQQIRR